MKTSEITSSSSSTLFELTALKGQSDRDYNALWLLARVTLKVVPSSIGLPRFLLHSKHQRPKSQRSRKLRITSYNRITIYCN